jgi:Translin-associated factor X-interacting N-terminus
LFYFAVIFQIIDYVSAYRPLMISIKAQYEEVIDAMVQGRQEAFYLEGKLSEMVNAPGTLRNYQRRADDLQKKFVYLSNLQALSTPRSPP